MQTANDIKISLIKWLIKNNPNSIIGNEVLFSVNLRRADLLMIKDNCTHAFEIKSEKDNVQKLEAQLEDYTSSFDYTTIVIAPKHLKQVKKLIEDKKIGIYTIEDNNIKVVRTPKKQTLKNLYALNILETLNKPKLIKLINKKGLSKHSVFDLRKIAKDEIPIKKIKQAAVENLTERYSKLFRLFKVDTKGLYISKDDLRSLTGNIKSERIY